MGDKRSWGDQREDFFGKNVNKNEQSNVSKRRKGGKVIFLTHGDRPEMHEWNSVTTSKKKQSRANLAQSGNEVGT